MSVFLDLQIAIHDKTFVFPKKNTFVSWCELVLKNKPDSELTIRLVDKEEGQTLNYLYRNDNYPTNILSFNNDIKYNLRGASSRFIGDLVICVPIVRLEAKKQNKPLFAHFAHLVIHGCLHLLGYTHNDNINAQTMEILECKLLNKLGYKNPFIIF